jgi:hypothetical protein
MVKTNDLLLLLKELNIDSSSPAEAQIDNLMVNELVDLLLPAENQGSTEPCMSYCSSPGISIVCCLVQQFQW